MPTFYAEKLQDGTWKGDSFVPYLKNKAPGMVAITINSIPRNPEKRSDLQNRYYWGVVLPMVSQEAGYREDEMHEILLAEFPVKFTIRSSKDKRRRRSVPKRSKDMTTKEFSEFVEKVRKFATSFYSLNIPDPQP